MYVANIIYITITQDLPWKILDMPLLDYIFNGSFTGKPQPKDTSKFKHEATMADLNLYMAKTLHWLLILTDDAIIFA